MLFHSYSFIRTGSSSWQTKMGITLIEDLQLIIILIWSISVYYFQSSIGYRYYLFYVSMPSQTQHLKLCQSNQHFWREFIISWFCSISSFGTAMSDNFTQSKFYLRIGQMPIWDNTDVLGNYNQIKFSLFHFSLPI